MSLPPLTVPLCRPTVAAAVAPSSLPMCLSGRPTRPVTPGRLILAALLMMTLPLIWSTEALAHRVNIFAWTEGPQIVVEAGFNGGNKVREGVVTVFDAVSNAALLEGRTDTAGIFRFDIPAEGRTHGLRIRIKAGEGHQNEWRMEASELAATTVPESGKASGSTSSASATGVTTPAPQSASGAASGAPVAGTAASASTGGPAGVAVPAPPAGSANFSTPGEMREIVNTALDVKLGPIRRELAEMREARPGPTEIFGGIGWLLGLAGIALYFKGRQR